MSVAPPRDRWLAREGDSGGREDIVPKTIPPRERRSRGERERGRRERAFRRVVEMIWREFQRVVEII